MHDQYNREGERRAEPRSGSDRRLSGAGGARGRAPLSHFVQAQRTARGAEVREDVVDHRRLREERDDLHDAAVRTRC